MTDLFSEFQLPLQESSTLSACSHNPLEFSHWLIQQPLDDPQYLSITLYTLLPQINQLCIPCEQRMELLDIIRPVVYRCIDDAGKQFLAQPLQLTPAASRIATMSYALLRHLCDGYIISARQLLLAKEDNDDKQTDKAALGHALYFALHGLSQLHFHCCQLYAPTAPLFWKKAHSLFTLAQAHDIASADITAHQDPDHSYTIEKIYKRLLIMACSHTNQLPSVDIVYLYDALERWVDMIDIKTADENPDCHYWFDPSSDQAPIDRSRIEVNASISIKGLDLSEAISLLHNHSQLSPGKSVPEIPTFFRHSLTEHLIRSWGQPQQRHHQRHASNQTLEICVGLTNAHKVLLNRQLSKETTKTPSHKESIASLCSYVTATDVSDEGFCLRWQGSVPANVQQGECILLRMLNKQTWQMGIIRWAQHINQYTYAGIQRLGEHILPTTVSTENSEHTLTKQYPSLSLSATADTSIDSLILPRAIFDETAILSMQSNEQPSEHKEQMIQLTQRVADFGEVSQYTFIPV